MGLHSFRIDATPGAAEVIVDGTPVQCIAARVDLADGQLPHVTLQMAAAGVIVGEGVVTAEAPATDGRAAAELVRALDPQWLREQVSARARTLHDDPFAASLEAIAAALERHDTDGEADGAR